MGKYSKVLEKAKDEAASGSLETMDHAVEPLPDPVEPMQPEKTGTAELQPPSSGEPSSLKLQEAEKGIETKIWDEKLHEIVSGSSKAVAESIKMLRTRIFYPDSGQVPRTIMVTSATPGEGKSFVCANLGVSIAQGIGKEALLVECDLRKPSLAKYFGLEKGRGLVDYLQSGTPVEQLIQRTSMPNLSLLSSGEIPDNPAELIDTGKMEALIKSLVEQNPNRLIIFDTPPIQVASETDVLAKKVDKIILVFRWGYSRREHAKQFLEMLDKKKILGVVFNAFEMTRLESKLQGYYYSYKDYYSPYYKKYYKWHP